MNTKDIKKKEEQKDGKQNSKGGNTVTPKNSPESKKNDSKNSPNKGNGKEKVDNKTVLASLNKKNK